MRTTRSGSENGRPRRKRSCIKLKMAVFIPMPSASVMTARVVNPGDLRSWRRAKLRSFISFSAQSLDWLYARGASSRKKTGKEGGSGQHRARNEKGEWIAWTDFVQDLGKDAASGQ